ncbi:hypothetical protein SAMN02745728_01026 [Desulfovibrio litoralis DSM 11393]|uniref:Uncharacterized protein n=1 Tax=Desulfovibrio litoralis DSM 11393 TaxID=1121455 RepID=A0A1M7SMA3_9BACT|nr:hypothetical protein SAMN02745728_01026 [Desulfovibrio litoralis DSM 11393]
MKKHAKLSFAMLLFYDTNACLVRQSHLKKNYQQYRFILKQDNYKTYIIYTQFN